MSVGVVANVFVSTRVITNSQTRGPSLATQVPVRSLVELEASLGLSLVVIVPLGGFPEVVDELTDFLLQATQAASRNDKTIIFFTVAPHSLMKRLAAYTAAVLPRQ